MYRRRWAGSSRCSRRWLADTGSPARATRVEDWTGEGWRRELDDAGAPLFSPHEAGKHLAKLAQRRTLTFFSNWITDVFGHRGPFDRAVAMLEVFDGVMRGLLERWDDAHGLIVVSSDHGNMEDLGTRKHTENDVPTLIVGRDHAAFAEGVADLTDLTPRILTALYGRDEAG